MEQFDGERFKSLARRLAARGGLSREAPGAEPFGIIPADGFYEWKKLDAKAKQPYAIVPTNAEPFAFAGLWERWKDAASGEIVRSCSIVTTEPNEITAPIRNRMPVILDRAIWPTWLGEADANPTDLLTLLRPCPAERMPAYAIGPRIGNVRNDDPTLLDEVA